MSTLVIEGGRRIEGRVDVEGNKNAALPLIAACIELADRLRALISPLPLIAKLRFALPAKPGCSGGQPSASPLRMSSLWANS